MIERWEALMTNGGSQPCESAALATDMLMLWHTIIKGETKFIIRKYPSRWVWGYLHHFKLTCPHSNAKSDSATMVRAWWVGQPIEHRSTAQTKLQSVAHVSERWLTGNKGWQNFQRCCFNDVLQGDRSAQSYGCMRWMQPAPPRMGVGLGGALLIFCYREGSREFW